MKKRKLKSKRHIYDIVSEAVEGGIASGIYRAHKHADNPSEEYLTQCIRNAIMLNLGEVVDLDEVEEV